MDAFPVFVVSLSQDEQIKESDKSTTSPNFLALAHVMAHAGNTLSGNESEERENKLLLPLDLEKPSPQQGHFPK